MSNYILTEIVEKVKLAVRLEEVMAEDGIELHQAGRELAGWHSNKHGSDSKTSLRVDTVQGLYICHNCKEGGDVITWLMQNRDMTFMESLSYLTAKAGIKLLDVDPEQQQRMNERREEQEKLHALYTAAADIYHEQLTDMHYELFYNKWNLTAETLDSHKFGFAPGGKVISQKLKERGFDENLIKRSGIVNKGGYDFFQGRLVFPYWKNGKVVYFIGRRIEGVTPDEEWEQAKYKKLPVHNEKNPHISEAVSNEYFAGEDTARGAEEIVFTEGIADCYTAIQAGFSCISPVTVSFREEDFSKMSMLARRAKTVYIVNDNEDNKAGEKGALATAEYLEQQGINVKLVELPRPEGVAKVDLADYLKEYTAEDLQELMRQAKTLTELAIETLEHNPVDPQAQKEAVERAARLSGIEADRAIENIFRALKPLKISKAAIRDEIAKLRKEQASQEEEESSDDEEVKNYIADFPGLVDICESGNGVPCFLVLNDGELKEAKAYEVEGKQHFPPPREQMPWVLAKAEAVQQYFREHTDQALYHALRKHFEGVSELPGENYYKLLAWWVLHSYLFNKGEYSPYIWLYAVPERGKSRTGKAAIYLAWRGVHVESLRDAYLVRIANNFEASIFFDCMDLWDKAEKQRTEDILLLRFEKGARVPRVLYPERGAFKDTVYYRIFGPTLIATNKQVHDILETRTVQVNMPASKRRFENDIRPEDVLDLKARLTAFRARHLNNSLPQAEKPASGRLGDVMRPLLQVVRLVSPEEENNFKELLAEIEEARKLEKSSSREAATLQAVFELENEVESGLLLIKKITEKYNEEVKEKYHLSPAGMGHKLKALGLRKRRTMHGMAIEWDENLLAKNAENYSLEHTLENLHNMHNMQEPRNNGALEHEGFNEGYEGLKNEDKNLHTGDADKQGADEGHEGYESFSECAEEASDCKNDDDDLMAGEI